MRLIASIAAIALYVSVLAALWLFPVLLFPAPTLNEANELAAWTAPLFLVVPVAAVMSLFLFRRRRPGAVPICLAVYLIGVGAAMILGLAVFGNFNNDQFLPLVLFPYPAGSGRISDAHFGVGHYPPAWPTTGTRRHKRLDWSHCGSCLGAAPRRSRVVAGALRI